MRKYGDLSELSAEIAHSVEFLISKIEENKIENCSIYYGYPLIELDSKSFIMKSCILSRKGIIVLYESDEEKKVYYRHIMKLIMECPNISELVMDHSVTLIHYNKFNDTAGIISELTESDDILSKEDYLLLNAVIQNMYGLSKNDDRELTNTKTLGSLIKARNNAICVLDEEQFEAIYKKNQTHARIRGLAGSGKTILLVKKMAYLHFKHPEYELAYVFYTLSLKQFVKKLFLEFYKDFEKYKEPNMEKIHILHSWGGRKAAGFYSSVCEAVGFERKTVRDVAYETNKLDSVCKELYAEIESTHQKPNLYDYVFVDEAQDFSLYFFKLALQVLRPMGKLIYAYDELQSLNAGNSIPSKYSIFGDAECEDINLAICYRTPKEILVSAHALGLGIYHKNKENEIKIVNMVQDLDIWKATGYRVVNGTLNYGEYVELDREDVICERCDDPVEIYNYESEDEQYQAVSTEIKHLIQEEDILPEDILIIDLDTINLNDSYYKFREIFSEAMYDEETSTRIAKTNLVNKDNAVSFRIKASIPYTTIFRAKGNEANIVFILNAHKMQGISIYSRNRLFTAMTRARFKVFINGLNDMKHFVDEYEAVKNNGYKLCFKYPTIGELREMNTIAKKEAQNAKDFRTAVDLYRAISNNPKLATELLLEQTGSTSLSELIGQLKALEDALD